MARTLTAFKITRREDSSLSDMWATGIADGGCRSVLGLPLSHFPAEMPQALAAAFWSLTISHRFFFFFFLRWNIDLSVSCLASCLACSLHLLPPTSCSKWKGGTFVQGGVGHGGLPLRLSGCSLQGKRSGWLYCCYPPWEVFEAPTPNL